MATTWQLALTITKSICIQCLPSKKLVNSERAPLSLRISIGVRTQVPFVPTVAPTRFSTTRSQMVFKIRAVLLISVTRNGTVKAVHSDGLCKDAGSLGKMALTSTMLTEPLIWVRQSLQLQTMMARLSCIGTHLWLRARSSSLLLATQAMLQR